MFVWHKTPFATHLTFLVIINTLLLSSCWLWVACELDEIFTHLNRCQNMKALPRQNMAAVSKRSNLCVSLLQTRPCPGLSSDHQSSKNPEEFHQALGGFSGGNVLGIIRASLRHQPWFRGLQQRCNTLSVTDCVYVVTLIFMFLFTFFFLCCAAICSAQMHV